MNHPHDLERFVEAQEQTYQTALQEIKNGFKASHWMWFIFPQIQGLGFSDRSKYYAINNIEEAAQYLAHPVLGKRLIEISTQLLFLDTNNAVAIFGSIDSKKLQSCMTLFAALKAAHPVFQQVLNKFFAGRKDPNTIELLNK